VRGLRLLLPVFAALLGVLLATPAAVLLGVAPPASASCMPGPFVWTVTSAFPRNGELVLHHAGAVELVDAAGATVPVDKTHLDDVAVVRLRPLALLRAHATYRLRDPNGTVAVVETSDVIDTKAPEIARPATFVGRQFFGGCPGSCTSWVRVDATDDDTPAEGLRYAVRTPTLSFVTGPARTPWVDEAEPHAAVLPARAVALGTAGCQPDTFLCWKDEAFAGLSSASLTVVAIDRAGHESAPVALHLFAPPPPPEPKPRVVEQVARWVEPTRPPRVGRVTSIVLVAGLAALMVVALRLRRSR